MNFIFFLLLLKRSEKCLSFNFLVYSFSGVRLTTLGTAYLGGNDLFTFLFVRITRLLFASMRNPPPTCFSLFVFSLRVSRRKNL